MYQAIRLRYGLMWPSKFTIRTSWRFIVSLLLLLCILLLSSTFFVAIHKSTDIEHEMNALKNSYELRTRALLNCLNGKAIGFVDLPREKKLEYIICRPSETIKIDYDDPTLKKGMK